MKHLHSHEKTIITELSRAGESGMTAAELSYCCGFKKVCQVYRPLRRLQSVSYVEETDMTRPSETSKLAQRRAPVFILAEAGLSALLDENWVFPDVTAEAEEPVESDEWTEDDLNSAPNLFESEEPLFEADEEDNLTTPQIALGNCELRASAALTSLSENDMASVESHLRAIIAESRR